MAESDHTAVDLRSLGYVREILKIARRAGADAEIALSEDGSDFTIAFGSEDAQPALELGGLRGWWAVPCCVESLCDGAIERYTYPDGSMPRATSRVAVWGRPEDLVSLSLVPEQRVQRGSRWSKGHNSWGCGPSPLWNSLFAPSGRVFYYSAQRLGSEDPEVQARHQFEASLRDAIDRGDEIGIVQREWRRGTKWIGTKMDLIEAGICEERHFPEGLKRQVHGSADGRAGVDSWSTYAIRRGYYEHKVWLTDEALAKRGPARRAEQAAPNDNPEDFAERCEDYLMTSTEIALKLISGELHGPGSLRYDAATVERVSDALEHAQQLLQSATPGWPASRVRLEKGISAARSDEAFRSFLASALTTPKLRKGPRRGRAA